LKADLEDDEEQNDLERKNFKTNTQTTPMGRPVNLNPQKRWKQQDESADNRKLENIEIVEINSEWSRIGGYLRDAF
jgi:hypothetical protein